MWKSAAIVCSTTDRQEQRKKMIEILKKEKINVWIDKIIIRLRSAAK